MNLTAQYQATRNDADWIHLLVVLTVTVTATQYLCYQHLIKEDEQPIPTLGNPLGMQPCENSGSSNPDFGP